MIKKTRNNDRDQRGTQGEGQPVKITQKRRKDRSKKTRDRKKERFDGVEGRHRAFKVEAPASGSLAAW